MRLTVSLHLYHHIFQKSFSSYFCHQFALQVNENLLPFKCDYYSVSLTLIDPQRTLKRTDQTDFWWDERGKGWYFKKWRHTYASSQDTLMRTGFTLSHKTTEKNWPKCMKNYFSKHQAMRYSDCWDLENKLVNLTIDEMDGVNMIKKWQRISNAGRWTGHAP